MYVQYRQEYYGNSRQDYPGRFYSSHIVRIVILLLTAIARRSFMWSPPLVNNLVRIILRKIRHVYLRTTVPKAEAENVGFVAAYLIRRPCYAQPTHWCTCDPVCKLYVFPSQRCWRTMHFLTNLSAVVPTGRSLEHTEQRYRPPHVTTAITEFSGSTFGMWRGLSSISDFAFHVVSSISWWC